MGKIILRLDRVMADRKITLKDLSEKVGVSNVNLSKMKTGKISAIHAVDAADRNAEPDYF